MSFHDTLRHVGSTNPIALVLAAGLTLRFCGLGHAATYTVGSDEGITIQNALELAKPGAWVEAV
ncbi:hypothetical protein ATY76_14365 [Rhizobium sp. R339]|nr:hypothetical protein ATY76_14365 [Rhizobium sp. R339]